MTSSEEFVLVNILEELVRLKVREAMREVDMCRCKKCELNACAITLNSLPSRYVTTTKGHLLAEISIMNTENMLEVTIQIAKALKIVKERPRH